MIFGTTNRDSGNGTGVVTSSYQILKHMNLIIFGIDCEVQEKKPFESSKVQCVTKRFIDSDAPFVTLT